MVLLWQFAPSRFKFTAVIDGAGYPTSYDAVRGVYVCDHNFGMLNNTWHTCNFTITFGDYSYTTNTLTITLCSFYYPVSSIQATILNSVRNGTNIVDTFLPSYYDWQGVAPNSSLILDVNGQNSTLNSNPWTAYYAYVHTFGPPTIQPYCYSSQEYQSPASYLGAGVIMNPFTYTFMNGSTYNMTLFAENLTSWVSDPIFVKSDHLYHEFSIYC